MTLCLFDILCLSVMEKPLHELDPSYDPERLTGSSEKDSTPSTGLKIPVIPILIPEYIYDISSSPFAHDLQLPRSIEPLADAISTAVQGSFAMNNVLVRGIQSGKHHEISRAGLIDSIIQNGSDIHKNTYDMTEIFAADYGNNTISSILGGFHVWKPKCREMPHYPVDVWMVFDKNAFDNIEYTHPRHNVLAKDKWKLKNHNNRGLKGVLVIN